MSKQEFIEEANKIYGNEYTYEYVNDDNLEPYTSIPITCKKHGLFYQTVYQHLNGAGCFECYKEKYIRVVHKKSVNN